MRKKDLGKAKMLQFDPLFKDYMVWIQEKCSGIIPNGLDVR